jgi:hypothetical protein
MAEIENHTISGVTCDRPQCEVRFTGPELPHFEGLAYYQREAVAAGWSRWAGRDRRWYCPDHGPSKGHKMHLVAGEDNHG